MREKLDASIKDLLPKLRELQRLLAAENASSSAAKGDLSPSARIWCEILLGMVGGLDEAAEYLRQELLTGTTFERPPVYDQAVQSDLDRALGIAPAEPPQKPYDKGEQGGWRDWPESPRDQGDDGGAPVGAGVRGPTPRRGPGAERRFEESDEPPRNP